MQPEKFEIGDIVYERGSRRRRKMIVVDVYSNGMVLCDVFPVFPWEQMTERLFVDWNLEK